MVTELEAKRHHPELGYFARQALRLLDDYRVTHGRLDAPISPSGSWAGTLRVGGQPAARALPTGYRLGMQYQAMARQMVPNWPVPVLQQHRGPRVELELQGGQRLLRRLRPLPGPARLDYAGAGADWQTNPATQIKWGLNYMNDRLQHP
ncbi:hypothetical protein SFUMM280S_02186 [Streptomyces fumanus]